MKFDSLSRDGNKVTLTLRNAYDFTNLNEFDLRWELLTDGKVTASKRLALPATAPGESTDVTLKLPKLTADKEQLLRRCIERRAALPHQPTPQSSFLSFCLFP